MKKTLLLLASAALLLVGCAKEQLSNGLEGELTKVTFTASLDNSVATKAAVDGDGAAASVNRCIMEIYYGDELFARQIEKVTDKHATFTAQVVSNRTYKVAFWADCVDDATTPTGLAADKYYTTNAGLTAIALKGTYAGNDDARDAFFHVDNYTVAQAGSSFGTTEAPILLKRPFAQMNVITTDWDKVKTIEALKPGKVSVTLKNPMVKFNAVTGVASADANTPSLEYTADVYVAPAPTEEAPATDKTLSMDYLFASDTKALIDIDWKALHGTDADVAHAFAAVPYQRNFRTNIKGALLTTQGQWTVEVYPIWETDTNGDFDYAYTSVFDIQGANDFVAQNQDKKEISVTFSTQPNDAGDPSEGTADHPINAIVTSLLKEGATYNIDVASTTDVLYVGDYDYTTTTTGTTYHYDVVLEETSDKTNAAAVNLVVTDNLYIGKLVVNSPSKSVSINGQTLESGHSYHINNLVVEEVSLHTVIIEKGMSVENLTMVKGGLEIHGTVNKATVPEEHGTIAVRDCENLNEELVYNVLKDHIAEGYVGVKGRTTDGLWDIIPAVCKIGSTCYGSLTDAVAAVQEGETITFVQDVENAAGLSINTGKTFTIDFNGHKYIVNKPGAGSTGTQTAAFQLIKGQTITFKNGTIKAAEDNLTAAVAPAKNIKRMFQSYANVTFEGMIIDGTNLYENNSVCEFACGAVDIKGATSITTEKENVAAINVDTWKDYYPEGASVSIMTTGTIGDIYLYAEGTGEEYTKSSLTIKKGAFASITDDGSEDWTAAVSGGTFTADPTKYLAPKCEAVLGGDGLYYVNKIYDCTATIEYPEGTVNEYNSFIDAVKAAVNFGTADNNLVPEIVLWQDVTVANGHNKTGYGAFNVVDYGVQNIKGLSIDAQGHTMKCSSFTGGKIAEGIIKSSGGAHVILKNMNFAFTAPASSCAKYCLDSKDGFFDLYNVNLINGAYNQLNVSTNSTDAVIKFYEGTYACNFQGFSMYKIFGGNFKTNPSKYLASDELTSYIRPEDGYYVVCNKSELPEISATLVDGSTISNFVGSEGPSVALSKASSGSILTLYSGNLSDSKNFSIFGNYLTIVQKGGVFSGEITTTAESCIIEEVAIDAETTKYQVVCNPTLAVAKIEQTGVNYPSLQSAINKLTNTQNTVVLLTDLTNQVIPVNMNYSYTVDLNGKTVDCSSGSPLDFTNLQRNNATITGNGMIIARSISTGDGLIHADNWASVVITIKNGTYRVDSSSPSKIVIYVEDNNTKLIIEGGKYFGEISAPEGSLSISSGLFSVNPSAYIAEGKHVVSLSEVDPEYADGYRFKVVNQAQ